MIVPFATGGIADLNGRPPQRDVAHPRPEHVGEKAGRAPVGHALAAKARTKATPS